MSDPGAPEAMALENGLTGIGLYLGMWGVMMVAMMFPSSVPLFRIYYRTLDGASRTGKAARIGAFVATYPLVWALTGLVPLAVNSAAPIATVAAESDGLLLGGSLLLLSVFQISPYKQRCLRHCRTPLGFLMQHHRPGIRGAVAMSFRFSLYCIGCCWALFTVMVVVGTMNLLWMAGITILLSLERLLGWGDRLAKGIGVGAAVAGGSMILIGFF